MGLLQSRHMHIRIRGCDSNLIMTVGGVDESEQRTLEVQLDSARVMMTMTPHMM
jgi:hypothetical protein